MYRGEADDSEGFKEPGQSIASGGWLAGADGWVGGWVVRRSMHARDSGLCFESRAAVALLPCLRKGGKRGLWPRQAPARHSTAQHSTAQHSTAQHSAPALPPLCACLQRCLAAAATPAHTAWKERTSERNAFVSGLVVECVSWRSILRVLHYQTCGMLPFMAACWQSAHTYTCTHLAPLSAPNSAALPRMGGEAEDFIFWNDDKEGGEQPS